MTGGKLGSASETLGGLFQSIQLQERNAVRVMGHNGFGKPLHRNAASRKRLRCTPRIDQRLEQAPMGKSCPRIARNDVVVER